MIDIQDLMILFELIKKVNVVEIYSNLDYGFEIIEITSFIYFLVNIIYGNIFSYFNSDKIYLNIKPCYINTYIDYSGRVHIKPTIKDIVYILIAFIGIYIKIKQYSKEKSIQKALKILKKVDLYDKKDKYPDELSGGQKQRVSIARTLLMKPKIIMLDEPTSALDREMKQSVIDLIQELAYEGMTIIIVSHEEEFVNKISNKIYEIRRKKIKKYDII
jgi:ABC-type dipeptide/oligopeptide/nickel transport system ATPase subunit